MMNPEVFHGGLMLYFSFEQEEAVIERIQSLVRNKQVATWCDINQVTNPDHTAEEQEQKLLIMDQFLFQTYPLNPALRFFGKLEIAEDLKSMRPILTLATCNPGGYSNLHALRRYHGTEEGILSIEFRTDGNSFYGKLVLCCKVETTRS